LNIDIEQSHSDLAVHTYTRKSLKLKKMLPKCLLSIKGRTC